MPRAGIEMLAALIVLAAFAAGALPVMAKDLSNDPDISAKLPAIRAGARKLEAALRSEQHPTAEPSVESSSRLIVWRGKIAEPFTSQIFTVEPFDRAVLSWNSKGTATFELGVGGRWFVMGKWGDEPRSVKSKEVDVDTLKLDAPAAALQFRVTPADGAAVSLVAVTFWRKGDRGALSSERAPVWGKKPLDVPKRSQFNSRTCSPTSLSMVLEYYGFNKPTTEVARGVYDHEADIYGNWPFNAAYAHQTGGFESYVRRMNGWAEVEELVDAGRPAIISVKGPPLFSNEGHLIVVVGFDKNGDVIVNNPARSDNVRRTYKRGELFKAWMQQGSGIAYVLRGQPR